MQDQFRTSGWIENVRMPVLIVHGDSDSVIPFVQGERVFASALAPKRFIRMIGSDHSTLTRDGLYDHIWRFLGVPFSNTTAYRGEAASYQETAVDCDAPCDATAGQGARAPL